MKTIGERIRQARDALELSGHDLAVMVGYKHQSSIANIENRASSTGGRNIAKIAAALDVSLDWLIDGPDGPTVPFLTHQRAPQHSAQSLPRQVNSREHTPYPLDKQTLEAIELLRVMSPAGRDEAIRYLRFMAGQHSNNTATINPWDSDFIPHAQAA